MYSLILMTAMAGSPDATAFGGRLLGWGGCYGSCCGGVPASCYGSCCGGGCCGGGWYSAACYGSSCYGSSCYGSSCYGSSCYGSCHGCYGSAGGGLGSRLRGLCHHKVAYSCSGCYGSSCYGSACWGSCYGSSFQIGCWGSCTGCCGGGAACFGCTGCGGYTVGGMDVQIPHVAAPVVAPEVTPTSAEAPAKAPATLTVDLPAAAKLYVDGVLTPATGTSRQFHTPELPRGQAFFYELKAEVEVNGRVQTEERRVVVRAGEAVTESFTKLGSAQAAGQNPFASAVK